ncbi:MAG: chromate transporter, partial [Sphaerochaetaceae bacterium]|nr:chromate transporter [Sphaerochaetaceae bacterium]
MKVEEVEKSSLWTLFSTFFCIGIVTFGGGYAMIPLLERQCCTKHKWSSSEEILEYYAVSQCTPGIIAVNVATFIGYKVRGIIGAIVGTLGLVCPSILIITFLANLISMFQDNIYVLKAFSGIRVAVCALLISAVLNV